MNREDVAMDVTVQNVEILRGRLEQAENLLQAVVDEHGELSCDLHEQIDIFLASQQGERNQCDGCQAGIPLVDGAHRMGRQGGYPDLMSCQKERYEHPEQAESAQGERDVFESFCTYMLDCTDEANRDFLFNFVQRWETWPDRAALAQPSPAPELDAIAQEIKPLPAEFAQVIEDNLPDLLIKSEQAPELERSTVYVEARQCDECQHGGINDSAAGLAACHDCDWTGPDPAEDKCPGCQSENCMAAACPQCGARYVLVASEEIAAPFAQAGQVPRIAESISECMALAQTVFARLEGMMPQGKKLSHNHVARRLLAELERLQALAAAPAQGE